MVREPDQIVDQELALYNTIPYTWPEHNCETIMVDPKGKYYKALLVETWPTPIKGRMMTVSSIEVPR